MPAPTKTVTLRTIAPAFALMAGLATLAPRLLALTVAGTAIVALEATASAATTMTAAVMALAVAAGFVARAGGLAGFTGGRFGAEEALQPAEEAAGFLGLLGDIRSAGFRAEITARFARVELLVTTLRAVVAAFALGAAITAFRTKGRALVAAGPRLECG